MTINTRGVATCRVRLGNWWPLSTLTKTYRIPLDYTIHTSSEWSIKETVGGVELMVRIAMVSSSKARLTIAVAGFTVWSQDFNVSESISINRELTRGVKVDLTVRCAVE